MLIPTSLLANTVQVEPLAGNTGDGESYGEPYQVQGNLNRSTQIYRNRNGDTVSASAVLLLRPGLPELKVGDRVSEGGDTWTVDKVSAAPAPGGRTHHIEAMLR